MLACWAAIGPIVATFHSALRRARGRCSGRVRCCSAALEKISGRIAVCDAGPQDRGRAPRRRRRADPQRRRGRRVRRGRAAAGVAGPEARRSASSAGSTSRARACRSCSRPSLLSPPSARGCGCWSPGPATPRTSLRTVPTEVRDPVDRARAGVGRRQGRVPALGRRVRRAQHRGRELRHRAGSRRWRPGAPCWPATSRRSASARGRPGGSLLPVGDPAALARAAVACSSRRTGAPSWRSVGRARAAEFDWSLIAQRSWRSYETVAVTWSRRCARTIAMDRHVRRAAEEEAVTHHARGERGRHRPGGPAAVCTSVGWRAGSTGCTCGSRLARETLDAQLLRAGRAVLGPGHSGGLDPASACLLAEAAHEPPGRRAGRARGAESDLSRTSVPCWRARERSDMLWADPRAERCSRTWSPDVAEASVCARRFHNDAVRVGARAATPAALVRALHLAGRACRIPRFFEMDDAPPGRSTDPGCADR